MDLEPEFEEEVTLAHLQGYLFAQSVGVNAQHWSPGHQNEFGIFAVPVVEEEEITTLCSSIILSRTQVGVEQTPATIARGASELKAIQLADWQLEMVNHLHPLLIDGSVYAGVGLLKQKAHYLAATPEDQLIMRKRYEESCARINKTTASAKPAATWLVKLISSYFSSPEVIGYEVKLSSGKATSLGNVAISLGLSPKFFYLKRNKQGLFLHLGDILF